MSDSLKLVPPDPSTDDNEDLITRLKGLDVLVDELIAEKEALKEEMEQLRLVLGLDRYDFDRLRQGGGLRQVVLNSEITTVLNEIELKLRKELGYE